MKKQLLALVLAVGAGPVAQAQTGALPVAVPCPYNYYPATSRPACVGGHTDRLLPIVYGRPAPQALCQARQGKVALRGCLVSGCAHATTAQFIRETCESAVYSSACAIGNGS